MTSLETTRRGFVGTTLASFAALAANVRAETPAAPSPTSRNPFVYGFRIGSAEAWSISDCNLTLREGLDLMWPVEERSRMTELLQTHGEGLKTLPLYANVLLVRSGDHLALFDSGFGGPGDGPLGWLSQGLATIGISPDQITASFLSHAHADHLNGFVRDGKPAFPNAPLYLLQEELDFWRADEPNFSKTKRDRNQIPGMIREVRSHFDTLQPLLRAVSGTTEVLDGLVTIEPAPGHTAGHACFRIRSDGEELLHLMDLAHHHLLMFADPSWTIAFDHDPETSAAIRAKYWAAAAEKHIRCYGFHLPWPGLGRIVSEPPGYRWHPEAWSW